MNKLNLLIILLTSTSVFAITSKTKLNYRLSRCLGREELKLHRNKDHYIYKLNQRLINRITGMDGVTLSEPNFYKICAKSNKSPSLSLLEHLMRNFNNSFIFIRNKANIHTRGQVEDFIKNISAMFSSLIIEVRNGVPPGCIRKFAPEINEIEEYMLYLSADMSFEQIVKKNPKIFKIFRKIRDPKYFHKKCKLK